MTIIALWKINWEQGKNWELCWKSICASHNHEYVLRL